MLSFVAMKQPLQVLILLALLIVLVLGLSQHHGADPVTPKPYTETIALRPGESMTYHLTVMPTTQVHIQSSGPVIAAILPPKTYEWPTDMHEWKCAKFDALDAVVSCNMSGPAALQIIDARTRSDILASTIIQHPDIGTNTVRITFSR